VIAIGAVLVGLAFLALMLEAPQVALGFLGTAPGHRLMDTLGRLCRVWPWIENEPLPTPPYGFGIARHSDFKIERLKGGPPPSYLQQGSKSQRSRYLSSQPAEYFLSRVDMQLCLRAS
jgi:hypothetical protein